MPVTQNNVVSFAYTLTDDDGNVIDKGDKEAPLTYLHGHKNLIAGMEEAIEGKEAGDSFETVIPPADDFEDEGGEYVEIEQWRANLEASQRDGTEVKARISVTTGDWSESILGNLIAVDEDESKLRIVPDVDSEVHPFVRKGIAIAVPNWRATLVE